ncbi:MAG: glycosyltransferase family 25 protein [Betaproteobacteria bacterium]
MNAFASRYHLALWPAAFFLLTLPFTHNVALRLSSLAIAAAIAFLTWRNRAVPPTPFRLPLLVWAGMAMLSLSWAIDPGYSLKEIRNEIGYAMICFFTFYGLTQGKLEWKLWNRALIIGFLIISAWAITACWIAGEWPVDAPYGGVGEYSTYLILVLPFILLAVVRKPRTRFSFNPAWMLLPILLVGGDLTLNRAFWPALFVVCATFILLYRFRTRPFRISRHILGITVLLAILTVAPFIETVKDKAITNGMHADTLVKIVRQDPRIPLWSFVMARISEHPLTGVGFGRGVLRQTLTSHFNNSQLWHAHNLFLNYALQMGVGGVLALTLLFGALAREFWQLYRSSQQEACLIGIAGLALLSGVIVKNMTDDFFVRHLALMFWALAGISLGYGRRLLLQERPCGAHVGPAGEANIPLPPSDDAPGRRHASSADSGIAEIHMTDQAGTATDHTAARIYVINLARHPERRDFMKAQLDALGLKFERVDAIDGQRLNEEEIAKNHDVGLAHKITGRSLSRGEIGCALSHLSIYRKMVEQRIPYAIIFEDDALLSSQFPTILERMKNRIDPEEEMIILFTRAHKYTSWFSKKIGKAHKLVSTVEAWDAHGYLVTQAAARKLLKMLHPVHAVADCWNHLLKQRAVRICAIVPYCVGHGPFARNSAIEDERTAIPKIQQLGHLKKLKKILHTKFFYQIIVKPLFRVKKQEATW